MQANSRRKRDQSTAHMMNACKQSARSHMAVCVHMLLLLLPVQNAEVIKRWLNEVQEAVTSRAPMVQFHAVALLHALRASDRLAVSKLVGQLTRSGVRSPMAQVLLIRYVSQVQLCARAQGGGGAVCARLGCVVVGGSCDCTAAPCTPRHHCMRNV